MMQQTGGKILVTEKLPQKSLIIVSNREPYIHKKVGQFIRVSRPAGGLTSAMDEVLNTIGGKWVAWGNGSADKETVDNKSCVAVPPNKPRYILKRVWLTPKEVDNYYHGYSNHVLWPLCHITLERVYFRKKYWDDYQSVNQAFANAILEEAEKRSIVWIHDYHLCLLPQMLRKVNPELTIAHFWHIPWPDYSVFRVCPQARELMEALLNNDLIGFQIPLFVNNFIDCVNNLLEEAEIDLIHSNITYRDHTTKLRAFPISVDYKKFDSLACSSRTVRNMEQIKTRYNLHDRYIGIGVDRLEYTKGLIKRFQAIDLFFDRYPEYRGKFTFIQITVPTRIKEPYISYKANLERLIRKINRNYSTEDWNPIIYRDTKAEHEDLVTYYRMSDVAIISSIYDGMNLVAKEFVASQVDMKGVLLLSELAGAAEELDGAILVNPYDLEEFSESIKKALSMPKVERQCRMKTLRMQVKERDIYRWISDILEEISILHSMKPYRYRYLFSYIEKIPKKNIFLFLDYDGTLTPIVKSPEKAILADDMRSIIEVLKEKMPVAIVSGRELEDIKKRVGITDIIYAGNHGAEIWDGERLVVSPDLGDNKRILEQIILQMRKALSSVNGIIIEEKGITASIHYRKVPSRDLGKVFDIFWSTADRYKDLFRITSGKKVFEIRPYGIWNKGDAVKWIIKNFGGDRVPIYIGDDVTDEDAFKILRGRGIGISVGKSEESDYYLKNQREVKRFLLYLSESND
jgi:alpha,alpha-trehalose-phosphate synthase [UDP-forming]/trehalose-phosphatase